MEQERPTVPVMLDREAHADLKAYCDARGIKLHFAATVAVREYLDKVSKQQGK
jgi:hypothetical protein